MSKRRRVVSASSAALVVSGCMLTVPLAGWAQMEEIVVTTRKIGEHSGRPHRGRRDYI